MAGQTPNTTILKSIDQVIQALNDLAANFQPSQPPSLTAIEESLTIIGDDFEAFNTLYEERSIAETVAQNTNFADLIAAIGQLSLVCAPEINVQSAIPTINLSCPPPVINIQTGGGGQTGIKLEDPPINETDPPPAGQEPDPNIDNRKCKAANFVYDKIYSTLDLLRKNHADTTQTAILSGWMVLVGALIGSVIPAIGTVVGVVLGIATAIWIGAVDISYILTALSDRHQDLVCALYNASDTTQAKDDFLAILDEEGVGGVAYYEFVGFFLITDFLKILFQAVTIGGTSSEALLDGYATSVDCGECVEVIAYTGCAPAQTFNTREITVSSVQGCGGGGSCYNVFIQFDATESGFLPNPRQYTVEILDGGPDGQPCGNGITVPYSYYDTANEPIGGPRAVPDSNQPCNGIHFFSSTPYTMTIRVTPIS